MNLRINLNEPINWPNAIVGKFLERPVDADAIFRRATILAVMRNVAPVRNGTDEYNYSFNWFDRHLESSDYPPLFAPMSLESCDPGAAMGALFRWDGGISETIEHDADPLRGFARWGAVTPGETFFDFVVPNIERTSSGAWTLEKAAKRGDVHACFAAHEPYRYWWRSFNKAIFNLTEEFPNHTLGECQILPYHFAGLPRGCTAKTFSSLRVDWTYHIEGYCRAKGLSVPGTAEEREEFLAAHGDEVAEGLMVIPPDTWWLMTAADFAKYDLFTNDEDDLKKNGDALRSLFEGFAHAVGFTAYADRSTTALMRPIPFVNYIEPYWLLDSPPLFKDNRLLQLDGNWSGAGDEWRGEFPAHGYAAMLAWLNYFEESNGGFAITHPEWNQVPGMDHDRYNISASTLVAEIEPFEIVVPLGASLPGASSSAVNPAAELPIESKKWDRSTVRYELVQGEPEWKTPRVALYDQGFSEFNSSIFATWFCGLSASIVSYGKLNGRNIYEARVSSEDDLFYGWRNGDNAEANEHLMLRIRALAAAAGGWRFRITGDMSCTSRFRVEMPNGILSTSGDVTYPNGFGDYPMYEPFNSGDENSATKISFDHYQFWRTTYSSAITAGRYEDDDVVARLKKELGLDNNGFPDDASRLPSFRKKIPIFFSDGWWERFSASFDTSDSGLNDLVIVFNLPAVEQYSIKIPLPRIHIAGNEVYPGPLGAFGGDIIPGDVTLGPESATPDYQPSEYPSLYSAVTAARYFAFIRYPRRVINPHIS